MSKEKIIEALNKDLSMELGAIIQYTLHHVMAEGMESPEVIEMFMETAKDEMKHWETLAERIVYLGGEPTSAVATFKKGGDLKKMIQDDLDGENDAIKTYKVHIKLCSELDDPGIRLMLEQILLEEEGHADTWMTTLGVK